MPTPLASLCYMLKLHRLLPNNRIAGQYLLTYLPEDVTSPVAAVSGCCLLARREVWNDIGRLDERIFGFGEDIDWCVRAQQAGWEVWYFPESIITHLKGQGGVHVKPYHKVWGMHQGMWVFYRNHLMSRYSWLITALVWLSIWLNLAFTSIGIWVRRRLSRPRIETSKHVGA
jgi:GT2 family glycosyltransferase